METASGSTSPPTSKPEGTTTGSTRGAVRRRGGSGDVKETNSTDNHALDRRLFQQQQRHHQHSSSSLSSLAWWPLERLLSGGSGKRSSSTRSSHRQSAAPSCSDHQICCASSRRSTVFVMLSFLIWLTVVLLIQGPRTSSSASQNNNIAPPALLLHSDIITTASNNLGRREATANAASNVGGRDNAPPNNSNNNNKSVNNMPVRDRIQVRRKEESDADAQTSRGGGVGKFFKDATAGFYNVVDKATGTTSLVQKTPRNHHRPGAGGKERDFPGCTRPKWQSYNFVNCNDIHEIDLGTTIKRQAGLEGPPPTNGTKLGYLASGLWRAVYVVDPRQSVMMDPVVLKIMKDEHDVNQRNFDRHRRDALTMERLTFSPHIVDIYGFCGNTVLTEFTRNSLDRVIYTSKDKEEKEEEKKESSATTSETTTTTTTTTTAHHPTRQTAQGRLELMLDVSKGLQAMHDIKGGPIVHADLQAKQFLINAEGVVKMNDFNRCRFMASKSRDKTTPCKFYIPSAPGKYRSPEEYKETALDEKLDIYSTANIFYGILTGEKAWSDLSTGTTKKYIKDGVKPVIGDEYRGGEPGSIDAALTNLTELAYALKPEERISASQLVAALEALKAEHTI